uniref:Uncharacterized protein n=1 Tax=Rhizophora mucronata TaxID=61149 RepID=A0A2P2KR85_RHIMU
MFPAVQLSFNLPDTNEVSDIFFCCPLCLPHTSGAVVISHYFDQIFFIE